MGTRPPESASDLRSLWRAWSVRLRLLRLSQRAESPTLFRWDAVQSHERCSAPWSLIAEAEETVYNMVMVFPQRPAQVFLNRAQFEARVGLRRGGLSCAKLPPPDAIVGPVKSMGRCRGARFAAGCRKRSTTGNARGSGTVSVRMFGRSVTSGECRGRAPRADSCHNFGEVTDRDTSCTTSGNRNQCHGRRETCVASCSQRMYD